jgi:hypothetical protein
MSTAAAKLGLVYMCDFSRPELLTNVTNIFRLAVSGDVPKLESTFHWSQRFFVRAWSLRKQSCAREASADTCESYFCHDGRLSLLRHWFCMGRVPTETDDDEDSLWDIGRQDDYERWLGSMVVYGNLLLHVKVLLKSSAIYTATSSLRSVGTHGCRSP